MNLSAAYGTQMWPSLSLPMIADCRIYFGTNWIHPTELSSQVKSKAFAFDPVQ